MRLYRVSAALLVAAALPATAHAQTYQCRVPERVSVPRIKADAPPRRLPVTQYTLALSWSPEFCKGRETRASEAIQCSGRNGQFGLVVHGLWPEGRGTYPQWCPTGQVLGANEVRRNLCMMPGARLQAHEWAKHGACMVRRPATYFKVTRILYESLRMPDLDRLSKEPRLTAGMLRDKWVYANPAWPREAVGVRTNARGWLTDVLLCYGKDFLPRTCDRGRFGARDNAPLKIWRGL